MTRAPSSANANVSARPMPCAAPVTIATLPSKRPCIDALSQIVVAGIATFHAVPESIHSCVRPPEGEEMSGRSISVSLTLALTALAVFAARTPAAPPGRIVITDVTIVDPSGAREFPRPVSVLVDAGHIVAVAPTLPESVRRGARVIAGRGRFLIPG